MSARAWRRRRLHKGKPCIESLGPVACEYGGEHHVHFGRARGRSYFREEEWYIDPKNGDVYPMQSFGCTFYDASGYHA